MSAKDIEAGRAYVLIQLRDKVTAGLQALEKGFNKFGRGFTAVGSGIAAGGLAVLGPMVTAAVGAFASAGDELQKMSIRTSTSVESLSSLGYAAAQNGSDLQTLGDGLFKMGRATADAALGSGKAVDALKNLGLNAKELSAMAPDKQMFAIADSLNSLGNEGLAAQYAFEIFGAAGESLLPMLKTGSAGMIEMQERAKRLGLVMGGEDADAAAALGDAMDDVGAAIKAAWIGIGAAVAPTITKLAQAAAEIVGVISNWVRENRPLIATVAAIAAAVVAAGGVIAALGATMIGIGAAIGGFLAILAAVKAVVLAVFSPFGVVIGIVAAAIAGLIYVGYQYRDSLYQIAGVFSETFGGILGALGSGNLAAAAEIAWAGFSAAAWSAVALVGEAINTGLDYLQAWIPGVATVRDYITQAFGGIGKAILAGRWDLAGQILMAKLQLVWTSGLDVLKDAWDMFITGNKLAFRVMGDFIADVFHATVGGIARALTWVMEKTGLAAKGTLDTLRQMQEAEARARQSARGQRDNPMEQMAAKIMAREQQRNQQRANIAKLEADAATAHADAGAPTLAKRAELARADLTKAIKASESLASESSGKGSMSTSALKQQVSLGNQQAGKVATMGTFSGAAASLSLGINSRPNEETAKNTAGMLRWMKQRQAAQAAFT